MTGVPAPGAHTEDEHGTAGEAQPRRVPDKLPALPGRIEEREEDAYYDGGWRGIDLTDERYNQAPSPPDLFRRSDGVALLYREKIHYFYGAPETGKSFAAQVAVAWTLNDGGNVVYVDFENDPYSVRARLVAVGATWTGLGGLVYVNPSRPWTSEAERRDFFSVVEAGADLVIVDGISNAMGLMGRSPLNHDDVVAFEMGFLRPLTRSGGAVVAVDHSAKPRQGESASLFGGQHKKAAVTGASFYFKRVAPFGRGLMGQSRIMLDKDKPGWLRRHAVNGAVAEFVLISRPDGSVEAKLNPPTGGNERQ